jgi:exosome complex RNA-binding protein Rrp42 (RNase PH superfamily)
VRVDGRSQQHYRQGDPEINAVTNSHGSVSVRHGETDLIVAAKVDMKPPEADRPHQDTIKFLVDW